MEDDRDAGCGPLVEDEVEEERDSVIVVLDELSSSTESLSDAVLRTTVSFYVPDEGGRNLWTNHFLSQAQVSFREFMRGVRLFGGDSLTEGQYELLGQFYAQLFGGQFDSTYTLVPPAHVSIERFGQISWLFPHASLPRLLADFEVLARASWFHGTSSLEEAQEAIRGQPKGCFLIRIGQGSSTGSLSVSRITDPMTVLHSRLYWNGQSGHWALKTRKSSPSSGSLTSPRLTALAASSMAAAVDKRNQLREKADKEQTRVVVSTLRSYLQGLKTYDNIIGVSPNSPRPLQEWVAKHSKALDLRVSCPGSPFAMVLSNSRAAKVSKK